MNSIIETLNQWGGRFADFAWPMLWQSSLLIVILFAVEFLLRRRIRASIRYAFWLVVLVKLCLPPTLALPTSPIWWLPETQPPAAPPVHYSVTYGSEPLPEVPENPAPVYAAPAPVMTSAAWLLLASGIISVLLLALLLARWRHVAKRVHSSEVSKRLTAILNETRQLAGVKSVSPVRLARNTTSPAICGLFRPAILMPQSLVEQFSNEQLRAVLVHELVHLKRRDVWVNCLQALLQIVYWWHPLLWLANARVRHVREEAVDDAVMLALRDKSETYAPTLLEVAKLALNRPLASLGLVGILESRSALRRRIERLVNFPAPRKAGLTFASLLGICVFSAVALPMGQAPASAPDEFSAAVTSAEKTLTLKVNPKVFLRNIKAKANWPLDASTDNWTKILLDIMRCETVDCSPPHGIAFNAKTGEITTRNTPEQLEIFRQVIEQLNRPDGLFEMPDIPRRKVLIEARCFWMNSDDREKLVADLSSERGKNESTPHWIISPEQFSGVNQRIASLNLRPFLRPRIQTADGVTAELWVGNKTNGLQLDCLPFSADKGLGNGHKGIDLVFRTETIGNPTGPKQELAGTNHYQASGEIGVEDGGGFVFSAKDPDGSPTNVVMVIGLEIITNASPAHLQQRFQKTAKQTKVDAASRARTLVADGKLFYEMGKFDEAERKLRSALALEPKNQAAHYYMNLVQAAKAPAAKAPQRNGIAQIHAGRRQVLDELNRIRLDHFGPYDRWPLAQVVQELNHLTAGLDSNKAGVHFFTVENSDNHQPMINPNTGLPEQKVGTRDIDINSVLISIARPLTNVTLVDISDAIVMVANKPIEYSISDKGIAFSPKNNFQTPRLHARTFQVNPDIFLANLQRRAGSETNVAAALRRLLLTNGLDITPPESIFYNNRLGMLFVRATEKDLDAVEKIVVQLNDNQIAPQIPPQIHIKARFLEVPKGTLNSFAKGIGVTNQSRQIVGILPAQNARAALKRLESRSGVEELAAPEVTTTSGRQVEMRATTAITIVTNFEYRKALTGSAIVPQTNSVEIGPVLNTIATVLPDGHTIDLKVTTSLTEFVGYVKSPSQPVEHITDFGDHVPGRLPVVLPDFQVSKADAHLKIWDDQTVVLGGVTVTHSTTVRQRKRVTDPNGGQTIESPIYHEQVTRAKKQKELLVLITVTLVDPAGNRIHSAGEMPFAKDSIPAQDDP